MRLLFFLSFLLFLHTSCVEQTHKHIRNKAMADFFDESKCDYSRLRFDSIYLAPLKATLYLSINFTKQKYVGGFICRRIAILIDQHNESYVLSKSDIEACYNSKQLNRFLQNNLLAPNDTCVETEMYYIIRTLYSHSVTEVTDPRLSNETMRFIQDYQEYEKQIPEDPNEPPLIFYENKYMASYDSLRCHFDFVLLNSYVYIGYNMKYDKLTQHWVLTYYVLDPDLFKNTKSVSLEIDC